MYHHGKVFLFAYVLKFLDVNRTSISSEPVSHPRSSQMLVLMLIILEWLYWGADEPAVLMSIASQLSEENRLQLKRKKKYSV